MYCSGCGSPLPNEVLSCPNCGKRSILDESDPPPSDLAPTHERTVETHKSTVESDSFTSSNSAAPVTVEPKGRQRHINGGSIILGVVALICMVIGAIQGFIPIFLIEGVAFGGLAWLCATRWPLSEGLLSVVLVSSLLLAGLVGITLDQDSFGPRYRYLSQGNQQLRIDEKAGRTDRLQAGGWTPVAFDKSPQVVSTLNDPFAISLSGGKWYSSLSQVCFTATNRSDYVLRSISILVTTQNQNDDSKTNTSSETVLLMNDAGGFINRGGSAYVCGHVSHEYAAGETWSYDMQEVLGWK